LKKNNINATFELYGELQYLCMLPLEILILYRKLKTELRTDKRVTVKIIIIRSRTKHINYVVILSTPE
jgi:hypothetical protein